MEGIAEEAAKRVSEAIVAAIQTIPRIRMKDLWHYAQHSDYGWKTACGKWPKDEAVKEIVEDKRRVNGGLCHTCSKRVWGF